MESYPIDLMNIMLVYVIDKTKTFEFLVGKIDVSFFYGHS